MASAPLSVKKEVVGWVWTVADFKDHCFISYDDACDKFEEMEKTSNDPDYGLFESTTYLSVGECKLPLPATGRMWHCNGVFHDQRSYFEGDDYDNAELVEVELV